MPRNILCIAWLIACTCRPGTADVIDVTVNGSVSGFGTLTIDCGFGNPDPNCVPDFFGLPVETDSYSFAATYTQLGTFTDAASGGSAAGQASQDVTATADSIGIVLSAGHSVSPVAVLTYFGSENEKVTVDFGLTSPSEMTFTADGFIQPGTLGADIGELLDSHGNVILMIPFSLDGGPVLLQPGSYELKTGAEVDPSGGLGGAIGNFIDLDVELDANFAPVPTPEPQGVLFAVSLMGLLAACIASRRRAARQN